MALSTAVITFDISDLTGVDFDAKKARVWVTTNISDGVVVDTGGNQIRIGDGLGSIGADGTGSVSVWAPGTGANPTTWQTYVHFDYAQRRPQGERVQQKFGPFTVTADADLADLIQEQAVPATYLSEVTGALQAYVDDAQAAQSVAEAAAQTATDLTGIVTSDDLVAALIADGNSDTGAALVATYVAGEQTATVWAAGQSVRIGALRTFGRITYSCQKAHTTGTYFLTDLSAGRWLRVGSSAARSQTLAGLGDSINCNGSNPAMVVATLAASAAASATTISINAPIVGGSTDFNGSNGYLIKVGSEYVKLSASNATGSGPYTLTLEGTGLVSAHAAGETVYAIPTYFNQGAPAPALVASILSDGKARFAGVYGRGGATVPQIRDTYLPLVVSKAPGYCYVMAGRNSIGSDGVATTLAAVTFIWDTLLAAGITPVASTIPPADSQTNAVRKLDQGLNAGILREAAHRGIPVDDLYQRMVDPATGNYASGFSADGTHPTAAKRMVQGAGIWEVMSATGLFGSNPTPFPQTASYSDTVVHPQPSVSVTNNALMLTGGGQSTGSGSTADVPAGWATNVTDAQAIVTRPTAPRGNGKAIKIARTAGHTNNCLMQTLTNTTLIGGHRYAAFARIKTNGFNAAIAADASFLGLGVKITQQTFSSKLSWFGVDALTFDIDGALSTEFIAPANGPLSVLWMITIMGTAATPAVDAQVWGIEIVDLTALGEDATAVWP